MLDIEAEFQLRNGPGNVLWMSKSAPLQLVMPKQALLGVQGYVNPLGFA